MTDINTATSVRPAPTSSETDKSASTTDFTAPAGPARLVELLFFAYRDFTGGADEILAEYGFGRAHHRVLHFVNRNPGLTVADLLAILKITKQSLARVLKTLIDEGFVLQKSAPSDRRKRRLFVTPEGAELAGRLLTLQVRQMERALSASDHNVLADLEAFLMNVIEPDERTTVRQIIGGGGGSEG